ncbi:MAG: hypothetical protein U9R33_01320, partial [candidate division NC10 bacterium]|nr:hypothetical protein [candidate division NC10 bacterium]
SPAMTKIHTIIATLSGDRHLNSRELGLALRLLLRVEKDRFVGPRGLRWGKEEREQGLAIHKSN